MSAYRVGGITVILTLAGAVLWIFWPPGPDRKTVQYACSSEDSLSTTALNALRVRVTLSEDTSHRLRRVDSTVGTTYRDSSLFFWTNGSSATVHRGATPLRVGCTASAERSATPGPLRDTVTYAGPPSTNGWRFTVRHPRSMDVSRPHDHITHFLYAGPSNNPPALTDGFTLAVRISEYADSTSLSSVVDTEVQQTAQVGGALLVRPADTTHRGRPALRWRQESAMGGPGTHWAIALTPTTVAHVSSHSVGDETATYDAHSRLMRQSLRFWRHTEDTRRPRTVPLALLRNSTDAPERGCDDVVFVDMPARPSGSRLSSALETLFTLNRDSVGGARHFLARTNETLHFDRATITNDTANVYLTGRLTGLRGVCDYPRARIQIEETARRVANVQHVVLYRNGNRTTLQPGGRGTRP